LHLERCLLDLKERFARCEIQAGEPIVPYRETIVKGEEMRPPANKDLGRGTVIGITTSKQVTVKLCVRPLPKKVTEFLVKNSSAVKRLYADLKAEEQGKNVDVDAEVKSDEALGQDDVEVGSASVETSVLTLEEFKKQLQQAFESVKSERDIWAGAVEKITAFAPRRTGPNLLIDQAGICGHFLRSTSDEEGKETSAEDANALQPHDFVDKISYAFQLACAQGPLCNEPVQGIAVFLEEVTVNATSDDESSARDKLGRLTGEIIKTVREAIRAGFLDWSPRLLLAMYSCEIQASTEVLGRVYEVLTRRRGRILSEALNEGTPFYTILSLLPVAQSFGFSDEIRKRTAGLASPQLRFEGFEILDEDPFWEPRTEEELEDLGEFGDRENVAKRYVDQVRARKGLLVTGRGKGMGEGEKGRTLKR
jgi:ribosome assembly protein 1